MYPVCALRFTESPAEKRCSHPRNTPRWKHSLAFSARFAFPEQDHPADVEQKRLFSQDHSLPAAAFKGRNGWPELMYRL